MNPKKIQKMKKSRRKKSKVNPYSTGHTESKDEKSEEAENPGAEEEEPQGDLNSFETPPVSYKPSSNGPEGKDWTRVDFIVDSDA